MLVGRRAECDRIDLLLAEARAGRSGALVLLGEPGIGKSALLDYAQERAGPMRVLRASGVASESELPFAGLDELLRPVLDHLGSIPKAQTRALEAALMLGTPASTTRFAVAAATMSLLAAVAEEKPLLCLVDDAHWLDRGSTEALIFACRRFRAEGIAMLFAAREGMPQNFTAPGFAQFCLTGLDSAAARALLAKAAPNVDPQTADRLIEITEGNPLALLELPSALSEEQLSGREPLAEPVPVGASIERAFLHRFRTLTADTQRALTVAAACDTNDLATVVPALSALGLSVRALEQAEKAGLVTLDEGTVTFRHPLVRSAVYQAASPAERRGAHRALSAALADDGQESRRAWHMAAAALGPDESVASALDHAARDAASRGDHATAATTFQRASHFSVESDATTSRLIAAGEAYWSAGQSERASSALAQALSMTTDASVRADIERLRGRILMWTGSVSEAHRRLVAEAERIESFEPARAALLLAEAVLPCMIAGNVALALRTAERAATFAEPLGGPAAVMAALGLGQTLVLHGDSARGRTLLERARAGLDASNPFGPGVYLTQIASCFIWIEEYEQAREILTSVIEAARAQSAVVILPFALATQSEFDFRIGNFSAAYASASESITLALQTLQETEAPFSYVTLARSEAVLGHDNACRSHVSRALELAERVGAGSIRIYAASALGLLDLGRGRPDQALLELCALQPWVLEFELKEPGTVQWAPDLIESYIQLGRRDDAQAALATFARQAEHTGRTWALAAAARCRGLLALDDDFDREFGDALRWHAHTPTPFERARTELSYGERLRRAGQRLKARERLRSAHATFESLGAAPWAERARAELRASGEKLRPREHAADEELTAQELQVALIVAGGATNREAAARLFLSPKTIEFHLSHIFRKLGLRSRTELARRFASKNKEAIVALLVSIVNAQAWTWDRAADVLGLAI